MPLSILEMIYEMFFSKNGNIYIILKQNNSQDSYASKNIDRSNALTGLYDLK